MNRGSFRLLVLAAVAMLAVHAWLAYALYERVDDFIYKWTWIEALIYAAAAIVVLRDPNAPTRRALVLILVTGALLRLMLLFAPPLSTDIFRYVWDGRVQAAGINPYRYIPADPALAPLRDAAIFPFINRGDYAPTIYPPLAQIVFVLVTRLGQSITVMKAAMVGFEALATWALLTLLRRRSLPPTRVLLYLWHPLPVWEFAGSGHVDAVAVACLALGLLAAQARRPAFAGAALGGLLLSKFFPVVLGPALYRRWGWRLPLAFGATVLACYLPYLGVGAKVLGFLGGYSDEEGLRDGSGLFPWLLAQELVPALPDDWARLYPAAAALILAALGLAVLLRRRDRDVSLGGALALALVATVLMSPHYAWYFTWLVPFLVFIPSPGVVWLTAAAAFFEPVDWPDDFVLVSAIYIPFLILMAIEIAWRVAQARRKPPEASCGTVTG